MYTKIAGEKFETKNTTPESLTLQKTFKQMVDRNVTTAIMEVSSHALVEVEFMAVIMILQYLQI